MKPQVSTWGFRITPAGRVHFRLELSRYLRQSVSEYADAGPQVREQLYDEAVPVDELIEHPENPNQGDLGALSQSLEALGFYGALIAQVSTHHVCAGNHRLIAARQAGITELPVLWLEIDDEQALRILLADNGITRLGMNDQALLAQQLEQLSATPLGLDGTGYDGDDLDDCLRNLDLTPPGDDEKEKKKSWNITVRCESEEEQEQTLERLISDGYKAKAR